MPCDTIQQFGVNLKTADAELLGKALAAEFGAVHQPANGLWTFHVDGRTVNVRDGQGVTSDARLAESLAGRINRAYAREAVKKAASRYGWALKSVSETKYKVLRRA